MLHQAFGHCELHEAPDLSLLRVLGVDFEKVKKVQRIPHSREAALHLSDKSFTKWKSAVITDVFEKHHS